MATAGRTSSPCSSPMPEAIAGRDPDDLHQDRFAQAVDRVNAELSVIEKVRRFVIADDAFTIENEQLTPSMKIRRHVIAKRYGERLDALYKR